MLVHRFLEESAIRTPEAVALVEPKRSIAYAELNRRADALAGQLVRSGVGRGERVALVLENSIELVAAYFGVLKAGAVAVPLPADPRNARTARAIASCRPVAAVVDGRFAGDADLEPLASIPALFVVPGARGGRTTPAPRAELAFDDAGLEPPNVRGIDLDLAAIIYTSGSTGDPRGVMLTHRNIVANTRSILQYLQLTARDRVMCVLPFYYVYGLSLLHTHVAAGGSVVIDNRFAFPNVVVAGMRTHEVTGFAGVPSTFALLLHRAELVEAGVPSLRYVTQAGGAMPPARLREWLARGWKAPFYVMYGATEASARLTYLEPSLLSDKIGSIGRPIPNVEIVVVRDDGTFAAPGEVGELVARGSNISSGYWNEPEETARRFTRLGYRTGDLGYADADGHLFLVGRKDDMMKVGAHRVGPKEIEDVLNEHPDVAEAAILPCAHEILGEAPAACVVLRDAAAQSAEALQAFCRSRLPMHKVPVSVTFMPELPKMSGVGKIDKVRLRAMMSGHRIESPALSGRR
jgi:amino acid adenylation domain-containing protein